MTCSWSHSNAPASFPGSIFRLGTWPPVEGCAVLTCQAQLYRSRFQHQASHSLPCLGGHFGFSSDRHSYVACLLTSNCSPTPAARAGGHLGPHWGAKKATRFPGLLRAGSKRLEGVGAAERVFSLRTVRRREGAHQEMKGSPVNSNGPGRFIGLLCCCPKHTEVLGHASLLLPMRAPQGRKGHRSHSLPV